MRVFLLLLLAGCQSLPQVPTEVKIIVPVACLDRLPDRAALLPDADLAKLDDYRLVIQLRIEQLKAREAYEEAHALLEACAVKP